MVPQKTDFYTVKIAAVAPDSPAAIAGLQQGDVIKKVNGRTIRNANDLRYQYQLRLGAKATTIVERNGALVPIDVTPRWKPPAGQGPTGMTLAEPTDARVVNYREPFTEAVPHSFRQAGETLVLTRNGITKWFIGDAKPLDDIAGPIGIARVTGEVARQGSTIQLVMFAAFLSLNLAIMNILPIPALDGGRLLFVAIEFVRRGKRIPPQKEAMVHMIGFVTLIAIMVIISVLDVQRILNGESAIGG
jgi:regulator of sigma E protease